MKRFLLGLIICSSIVTVASADTTSTTGFIPNQIWYSKEPLVQGDTVKIYTAVWNGTASSASFHVQFYDGTTLLGERDSTIAAEDIQDISISWKVTAGDHSISAKINSSTTTTAGKKENVVVETTTTSVDHQFVPVAAKATATSEVKTEIDKATNAVKNIFPDSVSDPLSTTASSVDTFRSSTYSKITQSKKETQKEIDTLSTSSANTSNSKSSPKTQPTQAKPLDATEKPIAYVKLFLLSIVSAIFGSKIIFYGLSALIVILFVRFIYRKARHK